GFAGDLAAALRIRTRAWDDMLHARLRRLLRLETAPTGGAFGGALARAIGLVVDAALAQLAFLVVAGSVPLVLSLAGAGPSGLAPAAIDGACWLLTVTLYFAGFWTVTGQTPGLRLVGLRVATVEGAPPSLPRALVRVAGLLLSIAAAFLGFVPVLVG